MIEIIETKESVRMIIDLSREVKRLNLENEQLKEQNQMLLDKLLEK